MKLLSSLHNPKSSKYGIYYSVVLSSISIILILEGLSLIHLSIAEHMGTYFEGFAGMYMLSRHEIGKAFLLNLARINSVQKLINILLKLEPIHVRETADAIVNPSQISSSLL